MVMSLTILFFANYFSPGITDRMRGFNCCIIGCRKRFKRRSDDDVRSDSLGDEDDWSFEKRQHPRTFHIFPRDPMKKLAWIQSIRRPEWNPSSSSRVCSDHFPEVYIDRRDPNRIKLEPNAIPSRFKARYTRHHEGHTYCKRDSQEVTSLRNKMKKIYKKY